MSKDAGGIGSAIAMAHAQGRYDGTMEFIERIETLEERMLDVMSDIVYFRPLLIELEDQIAQNKIVLQALLKKQTGI